MGATKRVAELILLTQGIGSGTSFMTVRFGNVLASSGSVVPRFLQQIKAGGPVTVTHPEMRRYFMLIPEAVQLVLHTAARGEAGRLYALEMGEPVKLVDMARDLIRLSGFVPEVEIPISFIGLRPGEKLYEELVGPDETTEASGIDHVMGVRPLVMPGASALALELANLEGAGQANEIGAVVQCLTRLVSTFRSSHMDGTPVVPSINVLPASALSERLSHSPYDNACPRCRAMGIQRSHSRSWIEGWRKARSQKRPYRCRECGWRGWLLPQERLQGPEPGVLETLSPDLSAIDASVIASAADDRTAFSPRDLPTP
jgi:hypothetical protein